MSPDRFNSSATGLQHSSNTLPHYMDVASAVIVLYDTLLSLSDEIEYVWRRTPNLGSVLYILTRYGRIITLVVLIPVDMADIPLQTCNNLLRTSNIIAVLSELGTSGFLLAHGYAICYKKRSIMSILLVLFVITNVLHIVSTFRGEDCNVPWDNTDRTLYMVCVVLTLLFDTGIALIALYHIITTGIYMLKKHSGPSFTMLLFQQGVCRFAIIAAVCFGRIIRNSVLRLSTIYVGVNLEFVLTAVLMCHFLIQIRKLGKGRTLEVSHHSESTVKFAPGLSVVGSIMDRASRSAIMEFGVPTNTPMINTSIQADIELQSVSRIVAPDKRTLDNETQE